MNTHAKLTWCDSKTSQPWSSNPPDPPVPADGASGLFLLSPPPPQECGPGSRVPTRAAGLGVAPTFAGAPPNATLIPSTPRTTIHPTRRRGGRAFPSARWPGAPVGPRGSRLVGRNQGRLGSERGRASGPWRRHPPRRDGRVPPGDHVAVATQPKRAAGQGPSRAPGRASTAGPGGLWPRDRKELVGARAEARGRFGLGLSGAGMTEAEGATRAFGAGWRRGLSARRVGWPHPAPGYRASVTIRRGPSACPRPAPHASGRAQRRRARDAGVGLGVGGACLGYAPRLARGGGGGAGPEPGPGPGPPSARTLATHARP